MPTPTIVVLERDGTWAEALRRTIPTIRIVETRSPTECRECWSAAATSRAALVVEVRNPDTAADLLVEHLRLRPRLPRIVVGEGESWATTWREAGAAAVVESPRRMDAAVDVLRRYFRTTEYEENDESADERPITERIRAALPWRAGRERP